MQSDTSRNLPRRLLYTIAPLLTLLITVGLAPIIAGFQDWGLSGTQVMVKRDPGKAVYWVLPGKRELRREDFGIPADQRNT